MLGLLLLYSMYRGYKTGLILVIINSIALLLAVALAFFFIDEASRFLAAYLDKGSVLLSLLAFLLVFFLVLFGLKWFGAFMASTVRKTLFGSFDQAAGAILGLFRMAFLLGSVLYGLELTGIKIESHVEGELWLLPVLKDAGPGCLQLLSPLLPFLRDILEKKAGSALL